jgi:predicted kinase
MPWTCRPTPAPLSRSVDAELIVVTGVPGAGKTTLGAALATALPAQLLSLDSIKERLYSADDRSDPYGLRMAAEEQLDAGLRAVSGPAVIDIWVAPERDTQRVSSLLLRQGRTVTEVLCRVPAELAVARYLRRTRSGPHRAADETTLQRIRDAAAVIRPLGVGRCIEVDTSEPVDLKALVDRLRP